jgi:hypothetical protein
MGQPQQRMIWTEKLTVPQKRNPELHGRFLILHVAGNKQPKKRVLRSGPGSRTYSTNNLIVHTSVSSMVTFSPRPVVIMVFEHDFTIWLSLQTLGNLKILQKHQRPWGSVQAERFQMAADLSE